MFFNNQNRPQTSVYGCSSTSVFIVLILLALMVFGGLFFFFRYFGLIIALGVIVWLFRKFVKKDNKDSGRRKKNKRFKKTSWSRDFEDKKNSSYDNIEREFEEVDDENSNDY